LSAITPQNYHPFSVKSSTGVKQAAWTLLKQPQKVKKCEVNRNTPGNPEEQVTGKQG
jgi:hypothetical protein